MPVSCTSLLYHSDLTYLVSGLLLAGFHGNVGISEFVPTGGEEASHTEVFNAKTND